MLQHMQVLGHHNFGLSLLVDNLKSTLGRDFYLSVIENVRENALSDFLWKAPEIKTEVFWWDEYEFDPEAPVTLTGMSGRSRSSIHSFFQMKCGIKDQQYINCVHQMTSVSDQAILGRGVQVEPLSCVAAYTRIEDFVLINRGVTIGHHAHVDAYAIISPGVHIGSQTHIGESVTIGMGATIFDRVKIGKNSIIGGGSTVTRDIPENVVAYGSPAKVVRENS